MTKKKQEIPEYVPSPEGWHYSGAVKVSHVYDGWYWYELSPATPIKEGDVMIDHEGLASVVEEPPIGYLPRYWGRLVCPFYRKISKVPKHKKTEVDRLQAKIKTRYKKCYQDCKDLVAENKRLRGSIQKHHQDYKDLVAENKRLKAQSASDEKVFFWMMDVVSSISECLAADPLPEQPKPLPDPIWVSRDVPSYNKIKVWSKKPKPYSSYKPTLWLGSAAKTFMGPLQKHPACTKLPVFNLDPGEAVEIAPFRNHRGEIKWEVQEDTRTCLQKA